MDFAPRAGGRQLAENRNDYNAWEESGTKAAVSKTPTIADGGYRGTRLVIPDRRERGQTKLPDWTGSTFGAVARASARASPGGTIAI